MAELNLHYHFEVFIFLVCFEQTQSLHVFVIVFVECPK